MEAYGSIGKYNRYNNGVSAMKCKNDNQEIEDSILYVEDTNEDEGNITYFLRWVVRDYRRIVPGKHYHCHNILIGPSIHNLRLMKYDTKANGPREGRLYRILLGLTPSTSCAKISFVLTGERNEEIHPEDKGTMGHILDRKCFSDFSESCLLLEHVDLVSLCKLTVAKSVRVLVGIEKSTIHQNFKALYDSGLFSDVKICVEGKEFNAHKIVLAARSPVFSAMLQNEMKENSESRIEIEDSNEIAVSELLRYLYYEKTVPLTVDLALDLFELADKYYIPTLKSETVNYLKCNFSTENILDILVAADMHDEKQLKKEAIEFVSIHLWYLLKSPKWKTFRTRVEVVDCILAYLSYRD